MPTGREQSRGAPLEDTASLRPSGGSSLATPCHEASRGWTMTTAASPEHLVSDVVLRDGSTIRIRPARPVGTRCMLRGRARSRGLSPDDGHDGSRAASSSGAIRTLGNGEARSIRPSHVPSSTGSDGQAPAEGQEARPLVAAVPRRSRREGTGWLSSVRRSCPKMKSTRGVKEPGGTDERTSDSRS